MIYCRIQSSYQLPIEKRLEIVHPRFFNVNSAGAIELLRYNGDYVFRPNSKTNSGDLTCTWQFWETNIVHLKVIAGQGGYRISGRVYSTLDEIVHKYVEACNTFLD